MTLRVGINGFGRIGRDVFRAFVTDTRSDVRIVAVNDLAGSRLLAHLLKYDTKCGPWLHDITSEPDALHVEGLRIQMLSEPDPVRIDWDKYDVDVVVEATGVFATRSKAAVHSDGGAASVIVTAPMQDADAVILFGTNHEEWNPRFTTVISAGSCTAHAVAPLITTLCTSFGWRHGHMTTVHPSNPNNYTVDADQTDWRLVRGGGVGVIPKPTSAVAVIARVLPNLAGRFSGLAYRVPSHWPGVVDLVVETEKPTDAETVLEAFRQAAADLPPNILAVSDQPLVASDYTGDPHSATVDASLVHVTDGTHVHVTAWYDNEAGYAHRIVDLLRHAADHHAGAWQSHCQSARSAAVLAE